MGLFGGTRVKTNMAESRADCGSDSKVLAEQDRNKVEVFERKKSENVKLRQEDVPGAILPRQIPEECTVKQLQRWLLCRGAKTKRKCSSYKGKQTLKCNSNTLRCSLLL